MQPKILKLRRQRSTNPRYMGPHWKKNPVDGPKLRQPVPELADLSDVRRNIDDPLFVQPISTPLQRMRIYFNSQRTVFILQWVRWREKEVRLSIAYPSASVAYQRWVEDRVRWKSPKTITITLTS